MLKAVEIIITPHQVEGLLTVTIHERNMDLEEEESLSPKVNYFEKDLGLEMNQFGQNVPEGCHLYFSWLL